MNVKAKQERASCRKWKRQMRGMAFKEKRGRKGDATAAGTNSHDCSLAALLWMQKEKFGY